MDIEYARKGTGYAYTFTKEELAIVRLGFKREISRLRKQIIKWQSDERNEGQATWCLKIEGAQRQIDTYIKNIEYLT